MTEPTRDAPTRTEQPPEKESSASPAATTSRAATTKSAGSLNAQMRQLSPETAPGFVQQREDLSPVQRAGAGAETGDVHAAAKAGLRGGGGALPHLDTIQQSFGGHDVSSVDAHVGGAAAQASKSMGARAYASGNSVAFKEQPDLHTAAHEAAHVVQQRSGVQLQGGVGKAGDSYEQHADRVADAVVRGDSAESLLGPAQGAGGSKAVQRDPDPAANQAPTSMEYNEDLTDGFAVTVGGWITELVAGREDQEVEAALVLRVPIYSALHLSYNLNLKVSHAESGYKVRASGKSGIAGGKAGGTAYVDLLGGFTVEVEGKSGSSAATLLSLAMEREVRSIDDDALTNVVSGMVLSNMGPLGTLLSLADGAAELYSLVTGQNASAGLWTLLAKAVWGAGFEEDVFAGMKKGEYVELIESLEVGGVVKSKSKGSMEVGVEGSVGGGRHRRIEQTGSGADGVQESTYYTFDMNLGIQLGPVAGKVEICVPVSGPQIGGKAAFTLAVNIGKQGFEAYLTIAIIEEIIALAIKQAQQSDQDSGELVDKLEETKNMAGLIYTQLQTVVVATLAELGLVQMGFEGQIEIDFQTGEVKLIIRPTRLFLR